MQGRASSVIEVLFGFRRTRRITDGRPVAQALSPSGHASPMRIALLWALLQWATVAVIGLTLFGCGGFDPLRKEPEQWAHGPVRSPATRKQTSMEWSSQLVLSPGFSPPVE